MAESRIDDLRRRLEREPGSRLFAQLAEELRKAGDAAEAVRVCRAGLAAHPAYPSARLTLGRALLDSGDRKSARTELAEAVRLAPDSIVARRVLAQVLDELSDLPAALEQYAAALRLAPDDVALRVQIRDLALRIAPPSSTPDVEAVQGGPAAADAARETAVPASELQSGALEGRPPAVERESAPAEATLAQPTPRSEAATIRAGEAAADGLPAGGDGPPPVPGRVQPAQAVAAAGSEPGLPEAPEGGVRNAPHAPAGVRDAPDAGELWEELAAEPAEVAATTQAGTAEERPADEEAGAGETPFSSSTLAELYLRQGLHEKAVEVYRHVLEADPSNGRARARLRELSPVATVDEAEAGAPSGTESRRRAIERAIAALEALLAALRRP